MQLEEQIAAAEARWLDRWTDGPTVRLNPLFPGQAAPDHVLLDHTGRPRSMSEFWADGPALVMFWRHFGCSCGYDRAERLRSEMPEYEASGMTPVVVCQGEPARAAEYKEKASVPVTMLCDPDHDAYGAYGVGHWAPEQVLYGSPLSLLEHSRDDGVAFQTDRRSQGRPLVDDPWRATAEFVIGTTSVIRLTWAYQACDDYPNPDVLTTAAQMS